MGNCPFYVGDPNVAKRRSEKPEAVYGDGLLVKSFIVSRSSRAGLAGSHSQPRQSNGHPTAAPIRFIKTIIFDSIRTEPQQVDVVVSSISIRSLASLSAFGRTHPLRTRSLACTLV